MTNGQEGVCPVLTIVATPVTRPGCRAVKQTTSRDCSNDAESGCRRGAFLVETDVFSNDIEVCTWQSRDAHAPRCELPAQGRETARRRAFVVGIGHPRRELSFGERLLCARTPAARVLVAIAGTYEGNWPASAGKACRRANRLKSRRIRIPAASRSARGIRKSGRWATEEESRPVDI
ncbi:hypothetical protein KM043_011509 [Ampulex compressa]|nr:hypothetical protein KM043_011509 [Ampulex compressa]